MSGLTPDERRSVMTLWAIACSPLYSGDDLTKIDPLGLELLTNDEVIAVEQAGRPASLVRDDINSRTQVWATRNADGSLTVALFDLGGTEATVVASWSDLGLNRPARARDLWARRDLGVVNERFEATLAPHACRLLRLSPRALQVLRGRAR